MASTKRPIGRPRRPKAERMIRLETTIRQDQLDWLNAQADRTGDTRADIIRAMIDIAMGGNT